MKNILLNQYLESTILKKNKYLNTYLFNQIKAYKNMKKFTL